MKTLKLYWEFARPFTLIAPALGVLSGGLTAMGAGDPTPITLKRILIILIGTLMAAVLNAASNAINQIYDLTNDRINKPGRPIPSGRLSIPEARRITWVLYILSWICAAIVGVECLIIVSIASFFTYIYSVPPLRTKRNGILANVTIAIPRGVLLKVAGWSTAKSILVGGEPWIIGLVFGTFLLGASTTKDFADMKGDEADGCMTLPIRYGVRNAARMIAPFFVLPFLFIPVAMRLGWLTGVPILLYILGIVLAIWGVYTVSLILRDPDALARTENHPSWRHMYLMMFTTQVGFAVAYLAKYLVD
ncbi:MAG: UbiA family prenyltransferase [Candidatus Eisenbacteria bacterium]|uniref:UbiA family prenyltransferase n=1 Tax=Eiseniibacteriota bacterium TaxID=2212470 RepID=A0A948RUI8_UNCEI|nr:UbiA family prenyltransferase [Candidatus Eisenbacteria bacterium]MBU1950799.1 UbiA family prenyltransferase [Candidatus Eisenbacteria bacterium]MBU2689717.1 UbiA family prenyltransferase [Candidatus Eisenbacteria bacterium]